MAFCEGTSTHVDSVAGSRLWLMAHRDLISVMLQPIVLYLGLGKEAKGCATCAVNSLKRQHSQACREQIAHCSAPGSIDQYKVEPIEHARSQT